MRREEGKNAKETRRRGKTRKKRRTKEGIK
jgi:hypothetical protein